MIAVTLVQRYGNFEKQCSVRAISNVHNNYGWYLIFLTVQNVLIFRFDKGRTEEKSNHHSQIEPRCLTGPVTPPPPPPTAVLVQTCDKKYFNLILCLYVYICFSLSSLYVCYICI